MSPSRVITAFVQHAADVPLEKLYTNKLVDEFNKFDREAVKKQAAAFDLKSLK